MTDGGGGKKKGGQGRAERLAAALKAHLRKRKDQARARDRQQETKEQGQAPAGDKSDS
jgi:hypothetical protein